MLAVIRTITSDTAQATSHLLSGVFLLSGFNVCIATGALVAGVIVHDLPGGLDNFQAVMSFSGAGLIEPIPDMVAAVNWTTLGAIVLFAMYSLFSSLAEYLTRASSRSRVQGTIVNFPTAAADGETADSNKKAANY